MMNFIVLTAIATLAAAAPTNTLTYPATGNGSPQPGTQSKGTATHYEATFDDLQPVAGGLVSLTAVGPYDGLDYQGINLISLGLGGTIVAGVIPNSSPNVGAYDIKTALTEGQPTVTTQYSGSVTDKFDFSNFYFGCVIATQETAASLPSACNITVTGYRASVQVAQQSFEFNPGLLAVTAPLAEAALGEEFKGIDTAKFASDYSVPDVSATLVDSFYYTTYNAESGASEKGKERQ